MLARIESDRDSVAKLFLAEADGGLSVEVGSGEDGSVVSRLYPLVCDGGLGGGRILSSSLGSRGE